MVKSRRKGDFMIGGCVIDRNRAQTLSELLRLEKAGTFMVEREAER